jgi:hypothetical protein
MSEIEGTLLKCASELRLLQNHCRDIRELDRGDINLIGQAALMLGQAAATIRVLGTTVHAQQRTIEAQMAAMKAVTSGDKEMCDCVHGDGFDCRGRCNPKEHDDWAMQIARQLDSNFFTGHRGLYIDEIAAALRKAESVGFAMGYEKAVSDLRSPPPPQTERVKR